MYFAFLCFYKNEVNITNNNNNNKRRKMCLKFCQLDPAISLSTWISMACSFKEDRSRIRIIN